MLKSGQLVKLEIKWINAQNVGVLLELTQVNVIKLSIGQVGDQCSECRGYIGTHTSKCYHKH